MTEKELQALIRQMQRQMTRETIALLLTGNDTQCFGIEQYMRAYQKRTKSSVCNAEYAAKHLRETGLVREVKPGVWASVSIDPR